MLPLRLCIDNLDKAIKESYTCLLKMELCTLLSLPLFYLALTEM